MRTLATAALQDDDSNVPPLDSNLEEQDNDSLTIEAPAADDDDDEDSVPSIGSCVTHSNHKQQQELEEGERRAAAGLGSGSSSNTRHSFSKKKTRHRTSKSQQFKKEEENQGDEALVIGIPKRRGLPASKVLPFLQQLAKADINGAYNPSASGVETLVDGQPREVWTCGQNSYGELAHGDTSSRKLHMIAEACQGRDIIGVAAGELMLMAI